MTDDEIRIAIAESQGVATHDRHQWDEIDDRRYFVCLRCGDVVGWGDYSKDKGKTNARCSGTEQNYPEDLNAIHAVEETMNNIQAMKFRLLLQKNSDGPKAEYRTVEAAMCHATARQRCEAYLRTIGKWK